MPIHLKKCDDGTVGFEFTGEANVTAEFVLSQGLYDNAALCQREGWAFMVASGPSLVVLLKALRSFAEAREHQLRAIAASVHTPEARDA